MVAADLVHGPTSIGGSAVLGGQNNSAEARFGEAIILWCTHTTGITATPVILTEVAILCSEVEAAGDNCAALEARADIQMLPLIKGGVTRRTDHIGFKGLVVLEPCGF